MDPISQRLLVQSRIADLHADAAAARGLRASQTQAGMSIRGAVGRRLIAIGAAIVAKGDDHDTLYPSRAASR